MFFRLYDFSTANVQLCSVHFCFSKRKAIVLYHDESFSLINIKRLKKGDFSKGVSQWMRILTFWSDRFGLTKVV